MPWDGADRRDDLVVRTFDAHGGEPSVDDVHLEVRPLEGRPWLAAFEPGGYGPRAEWPAKAVAAPGGRSFFLLVEGLAYRVDAHEPDRWEVVDLYPITGVHVVEDPPVVVLEELQDLEAHGSEGRMWKTDRLASDDVAVTGVQDGALTVSGWDGDDHEYVVDLVTGAVLERRSLRPPSRRWWRRLRTP